MGYESDVVTELIGKEVYTVNGLFVGEIEDLRMDVQAESVTGLALGSPNPVLFRGVVDSGKGVILPFRWIDSINDMVLVKDIVERAAQPDDDDEAGDEVGSPEISSP